MALNHSAQLISVGDLGRKERYMVPIYQRNYAWEEEQIVALLDDIADAMHSSKDKKRPYYIGSLVVKRKVQDEDELLFEVVDGQQRLTTLAIIRSVFDMDELEGEDSHPWLAFEARIESENAILGGGSDGVNKIRRAKKIVKGWVAKNLSNDNEEVCSEHVRDQYRRYLSGFVQLIRVELPEGTDLNHYFEIMNTRGEQLEKHEILKAHILVMLGGEKDREIGARIWDACAEMDGYVDKTLKELPEFRWVMDWESEEGSSVSSVSKQGDKLKSIIIGIEPKESMMENRGEPPGKDASGDENCRYRSIINFPNFLLVALYVYNLRKGRDDRKVILDDKKLIIQFESAWNDVDRNDVGGRKWAKEFLITLLECRQLFDQYVVKREINEGVDESQWSLKKYIDDKSDQRYSNTFGKTKTQRFARTILSMLHVSHSSQTHKYWLVAVLQYLYRHSDGLNGEDYLRYLEHLASTIALKILIKGRVDDFHSVIREMEYQEKLGSPPESKHWPIDRGVHTHHYLFDWLEYLLWKEICSNSGAIERAALEGLVSRSCDGRQSGGFDGKILEKQSSNSYRFKIRSSVEHHHAQNDRTSSHSEWNEECLDSFGNLALVHSEWNSSLSNKSVAEKKGQIKNSRSIVSLKQVVMASYEKWDTDSVEHHRCVMVELMKGALCNVG